MWRGWDKLFRAFVTRLQPALRAGRRRGSRRGLLAVLLRRARWRWTFFYTVQSPADEMRLRGSGTPWPTEETRAHLGPGVYAWKHRSDARTYRRMLLPQVADLRILPFAVLCSRLRSMTRIDVDAQPDPNTWMRQYSFLGTSTPRPPRAQYIRRHTGVPRGEGTAVEHYFARSVFPNLIFFRGYVRAD